MRELFNRLKRMYEWMCGIERFGDIIYDPRNIKQKGKEYGIRKT